MTKENAELREGKKVFFIVPELSLFPEDFLVQYFRLGYETYVIDDDPYCSLKDKIDILFSLFGELVLMINIDRKIRGIEWDSFVRELKAKYGARARVGVLYRRRNSPDEAFVIAKTFLYDIGINGGCIAIEYQKKKNLELMRRVLTANQTRGRRKHLRVICDDGYRLNFRYKAKMYHCRIRDFSLSHFSCVCAEESPELEPRTVIDDIQMNLHGVLLQISGIFCMTRDFDDERIFVFVFSKEPGAVTGNCGRRLNDLIYAYWFSRMTTLLKTEFGAARAQILLERKNARAESRCAAEAKEPDEALAIAR